MIFKKKTPPAAPKYPGTRAAMDGNTAVIMCERESTDAAGAYPITPSTQMGEYWAEETARGHLNTSGRPLIFIEPEGEHAAAAVTAGLSMTGLRSANFSSGQGIAYMHESLYAAVGKRLTYVLNIGARAMTKSNLNVHAGHDDYHCIDDTGMFQMFAKDAQSAADLNIISHRIAELSLTPGAIAQDGFLTTHLIESLMIPERALIDEYLGQPHDMIDTPTAAQRILYGDKRRRIPLLWDVDNPVMAGLVQNQEAYMQSVASQRPFFFDHIEELSAQAFAEFKELTGRDYSPVMTYKCDDADYLIIGQGSVIPTAEIVADYLRKTRKIKVGVVNLVMWRPFPEAALSRIIRGRKGVAVLERLDQPLAVDLPIVREIRATISKCMENGRDKGNRPYPHVEAYSKISDIPPLFSGSFGMGSRDLQPEGIIGAVENMLPDGPKKTFYYLSIDFIREGIKSPKVTLHQENIERGYPDVRDLAVRGSENPNLMPEKSITVRFHSVGGWGAITTGKNLAMTLFELLGYHIKANPKYGSEKKGQPTTYYLSAAPEVIKVNCEYFYVDVVLSPDPNVFSHTNALAGLRDGGVFIIQSEFSSPQAIWETVPAKYQQIIIDKGIKLFALDAFKIARETASDADLQLRMQGNAFQGAFFAASTIVQDAGLTEKQLLDAIHAQLQYKFGAKGARIVEENVRVVQRGFDEIIAVPAGAVSEMTAQDKLKAAGPPMPALLKRLPASDAAITDIQRFWEQTGAFYAAGEGADQLTDPFIGLGTMPATSSVFRDMTSIRFDHPEWIPENCTACGDCYTVCPDTAIPGLVTEVGKALDTVVARLRKAGHDLVHLPKAVRHLERNLRSIFDGAEDTDDVSGLIEEGIRDTLEGSDLDEDGLDVLTAEFDLFRGGMGSFQFALTKPYYTNVEKKTKGAGGLFSITINPYTCKGCMECVTECSDDALVSVTQTQDSIKGLQEGWDFWLDLPNTPKRYQRVTDLEAGAGALHTILLDKTNYLSLPSGDGACNGCSEKTVLHLFTATVEALMQPRVEVHLAKVGQLIDRLRVHIQTRLVGKIDVADPTAMARMLAEHEGRDMTLESIAHEAMAVQGSEPIDQEWLAEVTDLLGRLEDLRWRYTKGTTNQGRASLGILNATGCSSVWGSTYPFNPYPYPWANHLFQDAASMAMGVFEGHMQKMADGFKAVRLAELELMGTYDPKRHDAFFTYFNWRDFSDEEWELCPPVVAVGGDGAMYDIGFQNLSRMMMSGKPIKALVLDTQVYSNTGGQACTSGFIGQVSDMAQYGKAFQGKEESRKEIGLIGMAHRTTFVLQGATSHPNHMIEGFIRGLKARRPALFNLYTSCQPEHGIGDDMGATQAKLAVESRAYPLFKYDPDLGETPEECFELDGNPDMEDDWPTYTLEYRDIKRTKTMEVPLTFADFAMTEARFRKQFRKAPRDTWNDNMVLLTDFLALDPEDRDGKFPFIWTVDKDQQLGRLLVSSVMVQSVEERRAFWVMLKAIARAGEVQEAVETDETRIQQEVIARIANGLMNLANGGNGAGAAAALSSLAGPAPSSGNGAAAASGDYLAPWIDTAECTACDECININKKMFKYDDNKKAYIADANAGTYKDLVRSAELCTAGVIHPGLPADRTQKGIDGLIKRAEPFN